MTRGGSQPAPGRGAARHYSGILVMTHSTDVSTCIEHLEQLAGVEIHQSDPETGHIIAVLESGSLDGQEQLLQQVGQTPGVLFAELVYYRRDDETENEATIPVAGH